MKHHKPALIIDHDAGTNPDDVLAFLFLLKSRADIRMTISGNKHPVLRAVYARQFFAAMGQNDIPCFVGETTGHVDFHAQASIAGSSYSPSSNYVEALKALCDTEEKIIYLAIQGLSNLSRFLTLYPAYISKFFLFHMGMKRPEQDFISGGTNMEVDLQAARHIYQLPGIDLKAVGTQTTIHDDLRITPETVLHQKLKISSHPAYKMIYADLLDFYDRRGLWPALHDPLTAACALDCGFVTFDRMGVEFREDGFYKAGTSSSVMISSQARHKDFMDYFGKMI